MAREVWVSPLAKIVLTNVCETESVRDLIIDRAKKIALSYGETTVHFHHMELAMEKIHHESWLQQKNLTARGDGPGGDGGTGESDGLAVSRGEDGRAVAVQRGGGSDTE